MPDPLLGAGFLADLALVFVVAAGVTLLFQRLEQPAVLGYVAAGVLVSPDVPPYGLLVAESNVLALAELGVVFLLFAVGLDWSVGTVRRLGPGLLLATPLEMGVMLAGGFLLGQALGWGPVPAFLLGATISVSSTVVLTKLIDEQGRTGSRYGQRTTGMSILEDVFAVILLSVVGGLLASGRFELAPALGTLARLALFVGVTIAVGYVVVPRLLDHVGGTSVTDVMVVTLVGLAFAMAVLAQHLGFAAGFGAFLAGFMIIGPGRLEEVRQRVEPLRDTFGAVFFVSIGLLVDPAVLVAQWPLVLAVAALVLVGKPLAVALALTMTGRPPGSSLGIGFALVPLGEMGFVIAGTAAARTVAPDLLTVVIGVVLVTTLAAPYAARRGPSIVARLAWLVPARVRRFLDRYQRWTEQLRREALPDPGYREALRRTTVRVLLEGLTLAVASILVWAGPRLWPEPALFGVGVGPVAWTLAALVGIPALVLAVRDLRRLHGLLARGLTPERLWSRGGAPRAVGRTVRDLLGAAALAGAALLVLLGAFPVAQSPPVALVVGLLGAGILLLLFDALLGVHRRFHRALEDAILEDLDASEGAQLEAVLSESYPWGITFASVQVREGAPSVGRSVGELSVREQTGATVIAVERGGDRIVNPGPQLVFQIGDAIVLAGEQGQVDQAQVLLAGAAGRGVR